MVIPFHPSTWLRRGILLTALVSTLGLFYLATPAQASPIRGNTRWSVLLCRFNDVAATPQPASFFRRMFTPTGAGQGGLDDYFNDQSYGKVRLTGSVVRGWYTMPFTKAQQAPKSRWQKIQDCVATAADNGYTVPSGNRVIAIVNDWIDSGAAGGQVLLDPGAWNVAFAAHEMGHGYGLGHSFSNDPNYRNASWSAPGEYDDPWDLMSAMNVYGFTGVNFGNGGVGLNAYHRDEAGWIPRSRILTVGANGDGTRTVTVRALESSSASGYRLVRVPFDPGDLFRYYTVELRKKVGNSRGIPASRVLIHEVRNGTPTLIRNLSRADRAPVKSLNANGVKITVGRISGSKVTVKITTAITTRCVQGYVWREARAGDVVCVTGATRSQVAADNAVKYSRWVNGAYGPHTCINGYVWREAFPGDDVCVTGAQRSLAAADNSAAASRRNPARLVYGPNTCQPGYVWREGDGSDYVCVTGATRSQVAADNAVRFSRWVSGAYGPHTCINGYVWREAWPGDDVCVTGARRSQAASDNAAGPGRVLRPGG